MQSDHSQELNSGDRFAFGANWTRFLEVVNEERIAGAMKSLQTMLGAESLSGKRFLDVGSGSGLFSLAARQLGASVHSFDFDPQSVACTNELRSRYFSDDNDWIVESGSVLDEAYLSPLGTFDVVYSWGVLHHTGAMWQAFNNVIPMVADQGLLFIAIYNDQGGQSRRWRLIKRIYNKLPGFLKPIYTLLVMGPRELKFLTLDTLAGKPWRYFENVLNYARRSLRGMSYWHDLKDWVGGYPFEVAKPEEIFNFYKQRGFELRTLKTVGGSIACNEFVLERIAAQGPVSQSEVSGGA